MTLGTVLLVVAMGLTYHNDQNLADQTLASKVNLPDPVRIQDFDRATHSNLLGEFQVLAEADLDKSVLRQFGVGETSENYLLLPVFAVGDGSRARAEMVMPEGSMLPHRPVRRPMDTSSNAPIAVLVYEMKENSLPSMDAEGFGLGVLGRGFDGDLVLVSGVAYARALWANGASRADVAVAAREIFGFSAEHTVPLIAPYRPQRSVSQSVDMSEARNLLAAAGLVSILFGASLVVRRNTRHSGLQTPSPRRVPKQTQSVSSKPFFDPLMPQDEIQDAEREARVSSQMSLRRLSRRVAPAISRLRSRR